MTGKLWTREELLLAINLYCRLPYGKLHVGTPEIQELANAMGRVVGSVAFKLNNFASLDPSLKERGIKGAANTSKLDREVWDEFFGDPANKIFETEQARLQLQNQGLVDEELEFRVGKEKLSTVKQRVNQRFFRQMILANYDNQCAITGINIPSLLIASHIIPWSVDNYNRLNPRNGIALNPLHDKAYEVGLISITADFEIHVSSEILKQAPSLGSEYLTAFHLKKLRLPRKFLPDPQFFDFHYQTRFQK